MDIKEILKKIEDFIEHARKPLMVLLGPTASGKTALSIKLARALNAEIISADSRQVYRGMDIGTDKILEPEREGIPHHLIDVADPSQRFTVVDFMKMADEKISDILKRGKIPLLAGGTGLYINALTENFQIPETGENLGIRKKLEDEMNEKGKEWLHQKLMEVDPETAGKIPPQSHLYILRALEVFYLTGKTKKDRKGKPKYETLKIGLKIDKAKLLERITQRVERQFERGLIDEVKGLLEKGYAKELASMRSIGYREVIAHLEGKISLEEAKKLIIKNTKEYARRQTTWFKRDEKIIWIEA